MRRAPIFHSGLERPGGFFGGDLGGSLIWKSLLLPSVFFVGLGGVPPILSSPTTILLGLGLELGLVMGFVFAHSFLCCCAALMSLPAISSTDCTIVSDRRRLNARELVLGSFQL